MNARKLLISALYRWKFLQVLLFNPMVEYHQWKLTRFVRRAAADTKTDESIIDIGAGELKYKPYFSHCRYFSNDLCIGDSDWNYSGIDIVSSAYDIPVESATFDRALCIQVLEHLDEPDRAFSEFQRLLKTGGRLYLSAPLIAGEHQQPYDFYRYTRFGLAALGSKHGFRLVEIEPHGGAPIAIETLAWATFWEILPIRRQSTLRYLAYAIVYPIKFVTGLLALLLDTGDRKKSFTINYDAVFEKL
jgi:SAM-dependent methyltransferase